MAATPKEIRAFSKALAPVIRQYIAEQFEPIVEIIAELEKRVAALEDKQ